MHPARGLRHKPGLSGAWLTTNEDDLRGPALDRRPDPLQALELADPTHQRWARDASGPLGGERGLRPARHPSTIGARPGHGHF